MISKNKIAYLKSLADRKTRHELGRFLVEGKKAILEVINSDFRIVEGFLVHDFLNPLQKNFPCELISEIELKKITSLTSNRDGVIIVPSFRLYWMASMIQEISVLSLELLIGMVFLRLLHHPIRSIFIIPKR